MRSAGVQLNSLSARAFAIRALCLVRVMSSLARRARQGEKGLQSPSDSPDCDTPLAALWRQLSTATLQISVMISPVSRTDAVHTVNAQTRAHMQTPTCICKHLTDSHARALLTCAHTHTHARPWGQVGRGHHVRTTRMHVRTRVRRWMAAACSSTRFPVDCVSARTPSLALSACRPATGDTGWSCRRMFEGANKDTHTNSLTHAQACKDTRTREHTRRHTQTRRRTHLPPQNRQPPLRLPHGAIVSFTRHARSHLTRACLQGAKPCGEAQRCSCLHRRGEGGGERARE